MGSFYTFFGARGSSVTADQTVAQLVATEADATVGALAFPSDMPGAVFTCHTEGAWTITYNGYSFPTSAIAAAADFTLTIDGTSHAGTPTDNFDDTALGIAWKPTTTSLYQRLKLKSLGGLTDWRARVMVSPNVTNFNYNSCSLVVWDDVNDTGLVFVLAEFDGNSRTFPINGNPYNYTGGTVKTYPGSPALFWQQAPLFQMVRDDTANEIHFEWSQDGGETWARLYTVTEIAATHVGVGAYGGDSTNEQNAQPHIFTFEIFDDS